MKFLHLADLHLGKRVNEYSMVEDQEYILTEILKIVDEEKPFGVIIAGDVYDKSTPSLEAVTMLDGFLVKLNKRNVKAFIVSGNHDSPERLSFGANLMEKSGIFTAKVFNGKLQKFTFNDEYGVFNIYALPFIKPINARRYFGEDIKTYTDAVSKVIDSETLNLSERNILITHQFVTGATRSESEEISVGGSDNVDGIVFDKFDYTALGHIHKAQTVGSEYIRYSGTPLKYSFSESKHLKSVTVVDFKEKGNITIKEIPLKPLRDMVELRGYYNDLTLKSFYENTTYREDFVHITLLDEEDIPDAVSKLKIIYKNLMKLDYDNLRTRSNNAVTGAEEMQSKTPIQLFGEFYALQNNRELSVEQEKFMDKLIEEVWGEEI